MQAPQDPFQAKKVRELFEQAFDLPENDRMDYLREVCDRDEDLLQQVKALLDQEKPAKARLKKIEEELIWPSLKSFKEDPSILDDWLGGHEEMIPEEEDALTGKSISHFKILEPIGRGGMGMVYKAHDQLLERTVALKFLPPAMGSDKDAKDRFLREAKVACEIDHPNIATVYEIGETDDLHMFIAMGYYQGESLKERIDRGVLSADEAIHIVHQLGSALDQVHKKGIIHRDIKPGNLMITEDGTVKLLDFGLAKLSFASGYTQVGQMVGTVAYMSPEQTRGELVDHRTDIWSLGIVLYEMLTGKRPFDGMDASSTMHAILEKRPQLPTQFRKKISKPLQEILGLCLAKNPDKRYQSATELLADLNRLKEGQKPLHKGGMRTWTPSSMWNKAVVYGCAATATLATLYFGYYQRIERHASPAQFIAVTEGDFVEQMGSFVDFAMGDYDEDGWLDLIVTDHKEGEAVFLYHNNQDGSFSRITDSVLAQEMGPAMSPNWIDLENDGDLDVFINTEHGNDLFFENIGGGTYRKVVEGDWLNTPSSGNDASWGDVDNDGFLDLYIANFGTPEHERNLFYRNMGDGHMEKVFNETNNLKDMSHGCLFTDYDNDGDLDLFVGGQDKVQFRNEGDWDFQYVPPDQGGIPRSTVDVDVSFYSGDYDNDGDLDIIYTTWKPDPSFLVYRNEGGTRFIHVPHVFPSAGDIRAMSAAWGDYDNDGFLDVFITNRLGKNVLYRNLGTGTFERILDSPAVQEGRTSLECTFSDYDNDGDLDLLVANGWFQDFKEACELYRNSGNSNNWISFSLVGTVSNRNAIGAKVRIRTTINGRQVAQVREVCMGNSQVDLRCHFGLGDAEVIEQVRIEWPSGIVQEMADVAVNQFLTITEKGGESK